MGENRFTLHLPLADAKAVPRWARTAWGALVATAGILFVASIPYRYDQLGAYSHHAIRSPLYPDAGIVHFLLQPRIYPALVLGLEVIFVFAFYVQATAIVLGRTHDRNALFFSLVFFTYPVWVTPTMLALAHPGTPLFVLISVIRGVGVFTAINFFLLFADGRFVPRYTRYLAPFWAIYTIAWIVWPGSVIDLIDPFGASLLAFLALMFGWLSGMGAQIIRYTTVSDPNERRQTKWGIAAVGAAVAGYGTLYGAGFLLPQSGMAHFVYDAFGVAAFWPLALPMPIAFVASMRRFKLFEMELVVYHTLQYAALTSILLLIFIAMILLGQLFLPHGSPLIVALSTLIMAAAFGRIRGPVQSAIDRRFYRSRYDAARVMQRFAGGMQAQTDLTTLSSDLLGVVRDTMEPQAASLWLRPEGSRVRM